MEGAPVAPLAYPDPPLTDGVVVLRRFRDDDVPAIVATVADADTLAYTSLWEGYDERDARDWLAGHDATAAAGTDIPFAIAAPDGRLLGSIALRPQAARGNADVGYMVAPDARGGGVATRALRLVCAWGFGELGLGRIELTALPANVASQRVAERVGFRREGVLRGYRDIKGRREDMVMFALLATDPAARTLVG